MSTASWQLLVWILAGWVSRRQLAMIDYLREENRVLREQLGDRRLRFTDRQRRRLAIRGRRLGRKLLAEVATLVSPDTILRWYRRLVARKYDGSGRRGAGRPRSAETTRQLVVQMATDNPRWGYTRIRGALAQVGQTVGRSTIQRILREAGLDPAPERGKRVPWATFLKAHWGVVAATDFLCVEVLTLRGLIRYHVAFVIDLATRRVHIAGIVRQPTEAWMLQMARNLTDVVDGFLAGHRYLILDRDPLWTATFRKTLAAAGVQCVRLPARSPNLNAYAERFVLSIESECLDRIVPLGERHLRWAIREYLAHYHSERTHQGLGNRLLTESREPANDTGPIVVRERLGGLLRFYHRAA